MSSLVPEESPFATRGFAQFWEGWQGRSCRELEVEGYRFPYIRRSVGGLQIADALPFGTPLFVDDTAPEHQRWITAFFALYPNYRSSLSMYSEPSVTYPGVTWRHQDRSVIDLRGNWQANVKSSVERKFRRAEQAGWTVRELERTELPHAQRAIAETDRRHDSPARFTGASLVRLHDAITEPGRLRMWGAVRDGEIGGLWAILIGGGYETGWLFYMRDQARSEGVGPLITYSWIERSAAGGATHIDLGASPNEGVRHFKETFGAQSAPLYCGTRRWHLWGT